MVSSADGAPNLNRSRDHVTSSSMPFDRVLSHPQVGQIGGHCGGGGGGGGADVVTETTPDRFVKAVGLLNTAFTRKEYAVLAAKLPTVKPLVELLRREEVKTMLKL